MPTEIGATEQVEDDAPGLVSPSESSRRNFSAQATKGRKNSTFTPTTRTIITAIAIPTLPIEPWLIAAPM